LQSGAGFSTRNGEDIVGDDDDDDDEHDEVSLRLHPHPTAPAGSSPLEVEGSVEDELPMLMRKMLLLP